MSKISKNFGFISFWYSNPSLDVVLALLLRGGCANEDGDVDCTVVYYTVLYSTALYCTVPAEEGGDVDRGVDVEGGVPPAPGEEESLARPHRALQQGHLGTTAGNGPSRSLIFYFHVIVGAFSYLKAHYFNTL